MSTFEKVRQVIADNSVIDPADISPETRLDELGMDSLEFIEMMIQVQGMCDVEIPEVEIARMNTVGDVCKAVEMCEV